MSEALDLQRMGTKVRSDPRPYKLYEILTGMVGCADGALLCVGDK